MRKFLILSLFAFVVATPVRADDINAGDLTIVDEFSATTPGSFVPAVLQSDYSNVTAFLGQAFANGGAANQAGNTITRMVMDDITPNGVHAGLSVVQVKFSIANLNAANVSVRPRIRFWFADGAGGGPGTYYNVPANVGFSFNPLTIPPGVSVVTGNLAAGSFTMPGAKFWAGITFDDNTGTTGATAAQLNLMGQGIFDPPTIGSSADQGFQTTAAGSFFPTANPAGSLFNLGGNPVTNFGWEFTVDAPVPTTPATWGAIKGQYRI